MEEINNSMDFHPVYTSTEYMYVNSAEVATGDNDFVVKVQTNLPEGLGRETALLLSPRMAKQLRDVLNDAVLDYEELVGEIYMGSKVFDKHNKENIDSENE